jgi:hypothetical protein
MAYLAAIEVVWHTSTHATSILPKPLARMVQAVFQPARTCIGYTRWLAWLALSYLASRELQARCKALQCPPKFLVRPRTFEQQEAPRGMSEVQVPLSQWQASEDHADVVELEAKQGSNVPQMEPTTSDLLHPPVVQLPQVSGLHSNASSKASTAWSTVTNWMQKPETTVARS